MKQPNIILITTDQQRFDTCGSRAPSFMRTPHFDHLCRDGLRFDCAYAEGPLCVPARTCIMTGQKLLTHGMLQNGSTSDVIDGQKTLPALMKDAGYQTAAIGKMHFTPERARHGFEEMILPADYYNEMRKLGHSCQPMRHGLGQNELYPSMATVPESLTLTNWTAEKCVDYIKERRDPCKPFFLWCSFSKPHPPLDPPEPYYSMYRNCDIPKPVFGDWSKGDKCPQAFSRFRERNSSDLLSEEIIKEARSAYLGLITQVDYNMGRVFAALQDQGMFQDTMFIYTSDHGEYLGDHQAGNKVFFHEPSAHIPFAMKLPAYMDDKNRGEVIETPITHADILPTCLAAAGADIPDYIDGENLIKLSQDFINSSNEEKLNPDRFVVGSYDSYHAITDGKLKYIYYFEGQVEQVFDLLEDPTELVDVSDDQSYEVPKQKLKKILIDYVYKKKPDDIINGQFRREEIIIETEKERRAESWPGYHTEHYDADVRH